ncbi:MAG: mercuric reductase [Vulcanimicrobiaceae bacterium]
MTRYELCIIGAGSAGFSAAVHAREAGKSVGLIERDAELSGLCILRGCMPAKTVLRSAELAHELEQGPTLGVTAKHVEINPRQIVRRKRRLVREFAQERVRDLKEFPIHRGSAIFTAPDRVRVGGEEITAHRFLIASGSHLVPPPIRGLSDCGFLTSDDALEMTNLPNSLLILGGGPVGCEFAQYFARLGVEVTLLQDGPELLAGEDADVGAAVRTAFEQEGIRVYPGVRFQGVAPCNGGKLVTVGTSHGLQEFKADDVFIALNRRANIDELGLEAASVRTHARGIEVNSHLQTSNPRIFAAGDALGRRMLVHLAEYGGRIAAHNAFSASPISINFDLHESRSVYTHPEVAVAGLNETQCRERGIPFLCESYPFAEHGRALTLDLPEGFVKMLAAPNGSILGVTIVGGEAADYIADAISLLYFKAKTHDVENMPHLHPTMAEIITHPAEALTRRLGMQDKVQGYSA